MYRSILYVLGASTILTLSSWGAVITVTTVDNANPGAGKSLVQALEEAKSGDSIQFKIPGDGPHYIVTPDTGYPLITQNNLVIDGYSQPGSAPNTNPLRAANNAKLKIVLDSREGGRTKMNYNTGRPGYGDGENAILGIFNASNVNIRGLVFLGKHTANSDEDPGIYCIALARDHSGEPNFDNDAHVNGCWFGVEPDGVSVTGGSATALSFFRHRDVNGGTLPELPNRNLTIGVKPGSTNPRAEFNVMVDMEYHLAGEAVGTRFSGNFVGVLPDGKTHWDMTDRPFAGATLEIGRYNDSTIIMGTDGDGVNDVEEGNIFGPPPSGRVVLSFYVTGNKNYIVAGNNFGVAVDGATRFPGNFVILDEVGNQASTRIGSDFDGVSDACEGNIIANNNPFDPVGAPYRQIIASAGAKLSLRGNTLINNYPLPINPVGQNPLPADFYAPHLVVDSPTFMPFLTRADDQRIEGTTPVPNENFTATVIDLYLADSEGMTNGQSLAIDGLPNGFVQGRKHLGTFIDNSAADTDKAAGSFSFDVSSLKLGGGNYTITASYVQGAAGAHNAPTVTSPFSDPIKVGFVPSDIASAGLTRVATDTVVFEKPETANLDNWEPFASVIGTDTFVVEANTFATGEEAGLQNYAVAFQKVSGGAPVSSPAFFGDNGVPYTGKINGSRQNGNPGRVAGDARPGAVNYVVGGEASPHLFDVFRSDSRWDSGFDRKEDGRYATIQAFSLNTSSLTPTPLTKALDAINGRLDGSGTQPGGNQIGRFGGDIAILDNGNILVVTDERSGVFGPAGGSTVAAILSPTGAVVKDSWLVNPQDTWSNIGAYKGGFVIRSHDKIYFYDNAGNQTGLGSTKDAGIGIDEGRGDGFRIASHINSSYVFYAGNTPSVGGLILAAWDSRTATYLGSTLVGEAGATNTYDRATLSVDALNRIAVAYECKPSTEYGQFQTMVRVFSFDTSCNAFNALTPSFFAFKNVATSGIRTFRPSITMTTKAILVAAKGEINRDGNPEAGANVPTQTTFYTVFSHPAPAEDPTPGVGGNDTVSLTIAKSANGVTISWPAAATGWTLESTDSLTNPNWTPVGGNNPASVSTSKATSFFRLRK